MSALVELFDGRRAQITLALGDGRAWVRTATGDELVDLEDVAPVPPPITRRPTIRVEPAARPAASGRGKAAPDLADARSHVPALGHPWTCPRAASEGRYRGTEISINHEWAQRFREANYEPAGDGSHIHRWSLDRNSVGTCACGQVKDFRVRLADLDPHHAHHRRPRKESKNA